MPKSLQKLYSTLVTNLNGANSGSLEGYYDNTIIHRIIQKFIVQCGDPTGIERRKKIAF
jgi:cyclophilin family peptidyl-prolyl cis-trans isomerase